MAGTARCFRRTASASLALNSDVLKCAYSASGERSTDAVTAQHGHAAYQRQEGDATTSTVLSSTVVSDCGAAQSHQRTQQESRESSASATQRRLEARLSMQHTMQHTMHSMAPRNIQHGKHWLSARHGAVRPDSSTAAKIVRRFAISGRSALSKVIPALPSVLALHQPHSREYMRKVLQQSCATACTRECTSSPTACTASSARASTAVPLLAGSDLTGLTA
jgi:hypothetical protein